MRPGTRPVAARMIVGAWSSRPGRACRAPRARAAAAELADVRVGPRASELGQAVFGSADQELDEVVAQAHAVGRHCAAEGKAHPRSFGRVARHDLEDALVTSL